jgi:hypothetical protein
MICIIYTYILKYITYVNTDVLYNKNKHHNFFIVVSLFTEDTYVHLFVFTTHTGIKSGPANRAYHAKRHAIKKKVWLAGKAKSMYVYMYYVLYYTLPYIFTYLHARTYIQT